MIEIDITVVIKIGTVVKSLMGDSPLNKASKKELEAAQYVLSCLNGDSNIREGLNRVLVHLESAYGLFEPHTYNFLDDEDKVLWDKRTYKNNLCIVISAIHMYLGNKYEAKCWLEDKLSEKGWISAFSMSLPMYNSTKDLFYAVYGENETYYKFDRSVEYNHELALHADDDTIDYINSHFI